MTDYGHDLTFGALLDPAAGTQPQGVVELAQLMESEGLDLVSLSDYPYWPERWDTLLQLTNIAAHTSRIRLATNVANLSLRSPAMLARQAMTLDRVSGGRFELALGVGSAHFRELIIANGGTAREPGESVQALREAVQLIRKLWVPEQQVYFHGEQFQLDGALSGPGVTGHIDIWLGVYRPRMLRMTGQRADAWVPSSPYLGPEQLDAAHHLIDEGALEAGRRPEDIRRVYNVGGTFAATESGFLVGPPRLWAEQLTELALTKGISGFLLYLARTPDDIRRFAREVAPAVREAVAKER